MGIELLNLDEPIEFKPLNQPESEKPLIIYIKPLEWFDLLEGQKLYRETGVGPDSNPTVEINTEDRDKWYRYIADRLAGITNNGEELEVTAELIHRLPPLVGIELVTKIFSLLRGVTPETAVK